ncbi:MAG: endonuclease III [Bacilli bacterium]|nr:endonuclease III [Bacilli bacterium]
MRVIDKSYLIKSYLDEILPNAKCELNYTKDYELLIATMLSAQTTDKRVNEVTKILFTKYDTIDKLSNASISDLEDIIRPLGTQKKKSINVKSIAQILYNNYDGVVLNDRAILESLPGVGRKTANVVLSNIYNENVIAVDTHVSRVSKRLGLAGVNDTPLEIEKKLIKIFDKNLSKLHHQLVLFGRYYCKAKNPECSNCRLKDICKRG